MVKAAISMAVVGLAVSASVALAQPAPSPDVPVRATWGDPGADGVVQVTLISDAPQAVTAFALQTVGIAPDGSSSPLAWIRVDALSSLISTRLNPDAAPGCPVLRPGIACTQPVQVSQSPWSGPFSVVVSAVIYEDGTIGGPKAAVSALLADRENEATAAEKWQTALADAGKAPNVQAAAALLQPLIDAGPAIERSSLAIRAAVVRALSQKQNAAVFQRFVAEATRIAGVQIAENRRHLAAGKQQ